MSPTRPPPFSPYPAVATIRNTAYVVGPPLTFLLLLGLRYALVHPACGSQAGRLALEAVTALGFVALTWSTVRAWRTWHNREISPDWTAESSHFMTLMGAVSTAFFTLLLLALWIPSWIIDPCTLAA